MRLSRGAMVGATEFVMREYGPQDNAALACEGNDGLGVMPLPAPPAVLHQIATPANEEA